MNSPLIPRARLLQAAALATTTSLVLLQASPASAAVTVNTAGGSQILLHSDAAGDSIVLTCTAGQVRHLANNILACSATRSIVVTGEGGNDSIDLSELRPGDFPTVAETYVDTGSGNDSVKGAQFRDVVEADSQDVVQGLGGDDELRGGGAVFGGDGDDLLDGPTDQASGGAGDDVIRQAGNGPIDGGPGQDSVEIDHSVVGLDPSHDLSYSVTDAVIHLSSVAAGVDLDVASTGVEIYRWRLPAVGTQTWDSSAFSGSVEVDGLGGPDRLTAGPGEDFLDGGDGDDEITGGAGFDYLEGGPGNDTFHTRDGAVDRVRCGDGTDTVIADATDVLSDCESVQLPSAPPVPPVPPAPPAPPSPPAAPETGAVKGPKKVVKGKTAKFRLSSTTAEAKFQCRLDKGRWKSCSSPHKIRTKKLKRGKHVLAVRAVVGNLVDSSPARTRLKVVRKR